jgi:hypothetical protein
VAHLLLNDASQLLQFTRGRRLAGHERVQTLVVRPGECGDLRWYGFVMAQSDPAASCSRPATLALLAASLPHHRTIPSMAPRFPRQRPRAAFRST